MSNAINFSSLIKYEDEVVGGSFKIERTVPPKKPASRKATSQPTAAKRRKSAAVSQPQPPPPAAWQWARQVAEVEHEVYVPAAELPLAPQPPLPDYYQQPPQIGDDGYRTAPGGIAHRGDTGEYPIVRRSRPVFAFFGVTAVVFAILIAGANQLGGKGGAMISEMVGNPGTSAAGQAPPSGEVQAQPQVAGSGYNLLGKPSISVATIEKVLKQYNSPAAGNGQAFYDLGVKYGVDPAFMLAFFVHESAAGTMGAAVATKSVGNIICAGWGGTCIGRFRAYNSYVQAAEDWYQLITGPLYIGAGLTTPDAITPRYAPSSDNNDPNGYAKTVERLVDEWRTWQ